MSSFAIVGAGRVGVSLGVLLQRAGHTITGCSARSSASLDRAVRHLRCVSSTELEDVIDGADCILIAVSDDHLSDVVARIAASGATCEKVVHVCGAVGIAPLAPLADKGVDVFAIHVLQSVPDVERGIERIPGSWFGVTCEERLRPWAEGFVSDLSGHVYWVAEEDRTMYHAAAVIASNYLVVLGALVDQAAGTIGPYIPLMQGTLANLKELGPAASLTGPVVRGDVGTIKRHLAQMEGDLLDAYKALGRVAVSMVDGDDEIRDLLA
ncbi:MAG: Rossmann-like and DUF2520 domain-containing protein [Actinomycetota bacterium]